MPRPATYTFGLLLIALAPLSCKKDESREQHHEPGPLPQSSPPHSSKVLPPSMTETFRPSEKVVVASGQDRPIAVAVTPSAVVWANAGTRTDGKLERGKGTIVIADKAGGEPRVLARGQMLPYSLRVDETHAYWTTEYELRRVPLAGGQESLVFEGNEKLGSPSDFAFIGERIAIGLAHPEGGGLHFVDKAGGKSELRLPVAGGVGAVFAAADAVYAFARDRHTIGRIPIALAEPTTLASDVLSCSSIVAQGGKLYWTSPAEGRVWVMPESGDKPAVFYAAGRKPWALTMDATNFYVTDRDAGNIVRIPKGAGAPAVIVDGLVAPHAIAVDDTNVYWTSPDNGEVARAAKALEPR